MIKAKIITDDTICINYNGKVYNITSKNPSFNNIKELLVANKWEEAVELASSTNQFNTWTKGKFKIVENKVFYGEEELPRSLQDRIISMYSNGDNFDALLAFYKRLEQNPSRQSVLELYDFLQHKNIPIDDDGYFYAYKAIRSNWRDIYSNTIDNSIGAKPYMKRNLVDDDRTRHCSRGYHVGSLEYVSIYGREDSIYVICKVDPANVVSVPNDWNCQKVRVTTYEVISEYTGPLPDTYYKPNETYYFDDEDWDEYNYDDYDDDHDPFGW